MPWPWKKAEGPQAEAPAPPEPLSFPEAGPLASGPGGPGAPLQGTARFRIDAVYNITGIGCIAAGVLLEGTLRFPVDLSIVPGPGSITPPGRVQAVSAMAQRNEVTDLWPGVSAGLKLRGVAKLPGTGLQVRWNLRKGDFLVVS